MTAPAVRPQLILPPGWALLPVSADNTQTAVDAFAAVRAAGPRDSLGPFVTQLERSLTATLNEAATGGAFAVALPLGLAWQVPVSTSIALSIVTPDTAPRLPSEGTAIATDAGDARRRVVDAPRAEGVDVDTVILLRTIDYTWVWGESYLIAFASISGPADPEFTPVVDAVSLLITTMLDALTAPSENALSEGATS